MSRFGLYILGFHHTGSFSHRRGSTTGHKNCRDHQIDAIMLNINNSQLLKIKAQTFQYFMFDNIGSRVPTSEFP